MASTATMSAQSTFANVHSAINYVRALVCNDDILTHGQFAWARMLQRAVWHKLDSTIPANHPLRAEIFPPVKNTRLHRILRACVQRNTKQFNDTWREIDEIVRTYTQSHPEDESAKLFKTMLVHKLTRGEIKGLHSRATGDFAGGNNFAAGSPEKKALCADENLSFHICFDIYQEAESACATLAAVLVKYLYSNKWRDDQRLHNLVPRPEPIDYFRSVPSKGDPDDKFHLDLDKEDPGPDDPKSGYGQIVGYADRLTINKDKERLALNLGYLLTAHVISGVRKDHGKDEQEHSITIIGHESDGQHVTFGFWDPDAATSTGEFSEPGFGLLYYADSVDCAKSKFPAQHKYGRLTTARNDDDLIVDWYGYHVSPPHGNPQGERHRYQVISMAYG